MLTITDPATASAAPGGSHSPAPCLLRPEALAEIDLIATVAR